MNRSASHLLNILFMIITANYDISVFPKPNINHTTWMSLSYPIYWKVIMEIFCSSNVDYSNWDLFILKYSYLLSEHLIRESSSYVGLTLSYTWIFIHLAISNVLKSFKLKYNVVYRLYVHINTQSGQKCSRPSEIRVVSVARGGPGGGGWAPLKKFKIP